MKKRKQEKIRKCLTIAGFDPCGGAGILADIKVFQRLGAYGLSVLTALTIQNTQGVFGIIPIRGDIVYRQLECLIQDISIDAIKIGMLYSTGVIKAVDEFLSGYNIKTVVLDIPIISTSGMPLLKKDALKLIRQSLIPKTTVITPNIPEAETLSGIQIKGIKDIKSAARCIYDLGTKNVVIKGGHFEYKGNKVFDVAFDGNDFEIIGGNIFEGQYHGTGCVYSSALTVFLSNGLSIFESARLAKRFVASSIRSHLKVGLGMCILNI